MTIWKSHLIKYYFQNVLSPVHRFLFTNIWVECEQESVNRSEKTLKIKQKQYIARKRASIKMADTPIRNNQSSEEIE